MLKTVSTSELVPALPVRVHVEDVVWQKLDGVVVLLAFTPARTPSSGRYYRLDETGTRMWELLNESEDVATAYARLRDEYDVDPSTLQRDLSEFIERLVRDGLLRVEASGA